MHLCYFSFPMMTLGEGDFVEIYDATTNPATLLGLADKGRIAKGNVANLIVVDPEFDVKQVYLAGERVK